MSIYAEGDLIKTTRTHRVVGVTQSGYVRTEDVKGLGHFGFHPRRDNGSLRVEMVKRANRKPKVGDMLDGRRVRDTMWLQGTVLRGATPGIYRGNVTHEHTFVLTAGGQWYSPQRERFYEFSDVYDIEEYEVVYLP